MARPPLVGVLSRYLQLAVFPTHCLTVVEAVAVHGVCVPLEQLALHAIV